MISKLITYDKDRESAIKKMIRAIDEYRIIGVETTLGFCRFVLNHEAFVSGKFDTHFVKTHFKPEYLNRTDTETELIAVLAGHKMLKNKTLTLPKSGKTNWKKARIQD